jgi:hypothetical protein
MKTKSVKRMVSVTLLCAGLVCLSACMQGRPHAVAERSPHPDGTYRGGFMDEGFIQVNLQFSLEDGVVTAASFRHLVGAKPEYNLDTEEEPYRSVVAQYEQALQHLVGKPLAAHLGDLYRPGEIVALEVDGYSGATIRANKIISSVRDALNRGPYQWPVAD